MRLIDADKLLENKFKNDISYNALVNLVKRQPSIDTIPMGKWQELKETILELRDNGGTGTQKEISGFLLNLMRILETEKRPRKAER